ncbi:MAG: hypothetical protein QXJ74_09165 [Nitrososphaera sp.]
MTRLDIPKLLRERGYEPLRLQDRIVSSAARRALAVLGEQSVAALLYHMSTMTGKNEKELLSNYVEFEKALWSSLGYGADILLKRFSDELDRIVHRSGVGLGEVLDEIRQNEPAVFARSIAQGENAALLYTSTAFRDNTVSAFFEPLEGRVAMAALVERPTKLPPAVARTTYRDLQSGRGRAGIGSRVAEWTSNLRPEGSALRLAKDNTWLVENGMSEPSHDFIGLRKAALLCAYDLTRIDSASAAKAIELHDFVVAEGLQGIYARG